MYYCKFCNKECKNLRSLSQHESLCSENPNRRERKITTVPDLTREERSLWCHYYYLYTDKYRELYQKKKAEFNAERNHTHYTACDIIRLTKKAVIQDLIAYDEPLQISEGVWECPICGLHWKDMGTHIERVHNLEWESFILKYGWEGSRVFFSEDHRDNLSKNKKYYYNCTEQGKERRKLQSQQVSGGKNPACRDEVRLKISRRAKGRRVSLKNRYNVSKSTSSGLYSENAHSCGYIFWTVCGGIERRFRSRVEYEIFLMFEYYGIPFEYEPLKLEYYDPSVAYLRHYMVDYVSGNRFFEVKPTIADIERDEKYTYIQAQLRKSNRKLEVLTPINFCDVFEIPESAWKPLKYFEQLVITNIIEGNCKVQLPRWHPESFYLNSSFLRKLGDDPKYIIEKGKILYENKKRTGN